MLEPLLAAYSSEPFYSDPWFWQFPAATLLLSFSAFALMALPWSILAWIDPKSMQRFKIQPKPFTIRTTLWPSIARLLVNNAMALLLLIAAWPLLKHSAIHTGELPVWWMIALQLLLFIFLDDLLFYWMHRYMHENKWLLRHVHSVHHRIHNTCAINGNYMHWLEFSLTAGLMLLGPILIGAHLYVVWIWVIIRQFEAVDGHCGYDIPWHPAHWLPLYDGAVYHDFHHARFKGNYAGFLPYLDRYMGNTYIADYLKYQHKTRRPVDKLSAAEDCV